MLAAVVRAVDAHRSGRVVRPGLREKLVAQRRREGVGVLSLLERELGERARRDRVDEPARRVVDPGRIVWLGVGWRERLATLDLPDEELGTRVPERDVAEDRGDGPELVHLRAQLVVAQAGDEHAQPLTLEIVLLDVRAV